MYFFNTIFIYTQVQVIVESLKKNLALLLMVKVFIINSIALIFILTNHKNVTKYSKNTSVSLLERASTGCFKLNKKI